MFSVIVIKDNVLNEAVWTGPDRDQGEQQFLDACQLNISNWDEYTAENVEDVLDNGYEQFGNGSVCFIDHSSAVPEMEQMFKKWWESQLPENEDPSGVGSALIRGMRDAAYTTWRYLLIG